MKFKEWFYCYLTVSQAKDLRNVIRQECCITEQTWRNWITEKYVPNRLAQKKILEICKHLKIQAPDFTTHEKNKE